MLLDPTSVFTNNNEYHPPLYPNVGQESFVSDPRGWFSYANRFDREAIDWICMNIFHLSEEEIDARVAEGEQGHWLYRDGDNYYAILGGRGYGGTRVELRELRVEDDRYYVEFYGAWLFDNGEVDGEAVYIAELGRETFDGVRYWTLYSLGPKP